MGSSPQAARKGMYATGFPVYRTDIIRIEDETLFQKGHDESGFSRSRRTGEDQNAAISADHPGVEKDVILDSPEERLENNPIGVCPRIGMIPQRDSLIIDENSWIGTAGTDGDGQTIESFEGSGPESKIIPGKERRKTLRIGFEGEVKIQDLEKRLPAFEAQRITFPARRTEPIALSYHSPCRSRSDGIEDGTRQGSLMIFRVVFVKSR